MHIVHLARSEAARAIRGRRKRTDVGGENVLDERFLRMCTASSDLVYSASIALVRSRDDGMRVV